METVKANVGRRGGDHRRDLPVALERAIPHQTE